MSESPKAKTEELTTSSGSLGCRSEPLTLPEVFSRFHEQLNEQSGCRLRIPTGHCTEARMA